MVEAAPDVDRILIDGLDFLEISPSGPRSGVIDIILYGLRCCDERLWSCQMTDIVRMALSTGRGNWVTNVQRFVRAS